MLENGDVEAAEMEEFQDLGIGDQSGQPWRLDRPARHLDQMGISIAR